MLDATIERTLQRVGCGRAGWHDETRLREYIKRLQQQLADAQDAARRAVTPTTSILIDDSDEYMCACGKCGEPLEHVRPGKWQCNRCEAEAAKEQPV